MPGCVFSILILSMKAYIAGYGFPRWTPPDTECSAIVDSYNAVGRDSTYFVWFDEDEEGAEAVSSACDCLDASVI